MGLIQNSAILKYVVYINPFYYCVNPFISTWMGNFKFTWQIGVDLGVSVALIMTYMSIAAWKLKWQA